MEDGTVNFGGHRKGSGPGDGERETREFDGVWKVSSVDPAIIAQILAIRENLILSDPLGATEQSVATVDLASVVRWLGFAQPWKVEKHPSFYVRVLNRLEELRPDLFDKLCAEADVGAVQKSTRGRVEENAPESK